MGCDGNNATPPSPAIAPGCDRIDPRRVAECLVERFGSGGADPRLNRLVPGFDAPFFQAGLAGYSDAPMRIIARRHGCPLCVTEALLDRTLLGGGRGFAKADLARIADNVPGGDEDHPLVGQIIGSDPAEMAAAAIKMVEQGARPERVYRELVNPSPEHPRADLSRNGATIPSASSPDPGSVGSPIGPSIASGPTFAAIDVNLACPVKKIARKSRGGHWLAEPAGAIAILEAVREAVPAGIPCTVKMRRAWDDTPEMAERFERIFDAAYSIGYAWVTVHARSVQQKYVGPSRWDLLADLVRRHPDRLILGSGDIWNAGDIFRMIAYCSGWGGSGWGGRPARRWCDAPALAGVSVARGCIGNPWIFRQARQILAGLSPAPLGAMSARRADPPSIAEQRSVLEAHFRLALAEGSARRRSPLHTARAMRKFAIRFAAHHPRSDEVRRQFIAVESQEDWQAVLEQFYTPADVPSCSTP